MEIVLSGHGMWNPKDGWVELPAHMKVHWYVEFGKLMPTSMGELIDMLDDLENRSTKTWGPGGQCHNLTLSYPEGIRAFDPATVPGYADRYRHVSPGQGQSWKLGDILSLPEYAQATALHWGACLQVALAEQGGQFIGVNAGADTDKLDPVERSRKPRYTRNAGKELVTDPFSGGEQLTKVPQHILDDLLRAAQAKKLVGEFLRLPEPVRAALFMNDRIKWWLLENGISKEMLHMPEPPRGRHPLPKVELPPVDVLRETGLEQYPSVEQLDLAAELARSMITLHDFALARSNGAVLQGWSRPDLDQAPMILAEEHALIGSDTAIAYESSALYHNNSGYFWHTPPNGFGNHPNCRLDRTINGDSVSITITGAYNRATVLGYFMRVLEDEGFTYQPESLDPCVLATVMPDGTTGRTVTIHFA